MGPEEIRSIAELIVRVLDSTGEQSVVEGVRASVRDLCAGFPVY